ncbi:Gfo/Idh/MocA family protein [Kriegella aquimaris]|uniref:Predicted dehydrogenase n=1 Tax=Kriegella aquimaris TaxID=192904 RepID=A0A1G9VG56_9FLAO|nr:Gfo/Idh/MocA family oxidoreductase [Kriegella aquimaris]SDM71027.1 Predicted dehydrogenase [Kriegella aquimaris]
MEKEITDNGRRNFVKSGASALAGGALLSSFPMSAFHISGKRELRIGLVGCGNRGKGAAHEALKTSGMVKLVALGDVFEDRLNSAYENLKNTYGDQVEVPDSRKFMGFDAYQKVIANCDVVLLATPPPFRPLHLEAAVKADKHVFIEKPLFVDIPGYHKVMDANELAKQRDLSLVVGLQSRYETGYQLMKEKFEEGIIGDITSLNVYYNVGAPKIYPRTPDQTEMQYQMRNWRYFTWLWGGQLAGQTIHPIDLMNWFMNDYPIVAKGLGGRQTFNGPDQGNTYDHHYAEFDYPNKIKLHVQSTNMNNTWNRVGFHVQGSKGYADEKFRIYDAKGELIWAHRDKDEMIGPSQKCQSDFINSVINNKPLNQLDYGAKSTLTTIIGRMAIHSGKIITVEEALKSNRSILPKEFSWDADMPSAPGPDGNYSIPIPGKVKVL